MLNMKMHRGEHRASQIVVKIKMYENFVNVGIIVSKNRWIIILNGKV